MKIKLELSPDANLVVKTDPEGNVLDLTFTPLFTHSGTQVVLAYGHVLSDAGVLLDSFSLVVSGASGILKKKGRTKKPVKSTADKNNTAKES
jgi:hypothetical protein